MTCVYVLLLCIEGKRLRPAFDKLNIRSVTAQAGSTDTFISVF